ncbi:type II secretion system F family protein [Heliorestis convoluta]|uniref:Type II secretion system (T2SS), F family protein n=1 Tax=Heliorestis convoluta TaxID=356322 RepID=A0A5Q2MXJ1_9FIRM|nr:type II secretion system F family protein [Heliorestis convoluta]QGG46591.1 type II secretion system (T2SS), F family protein [Heliorestis convoluta]
MPQYNYQVLDQEGEFVQGKMDADNQQTVIARLRTMGLLIIDIKEARSSPLTALQLEENVKIGDVLIFTRQLGAVLSAGIPLTRALFTLSAQANNKQIKKNVEQIARNVEAGTSFSESLQAYPKMFSPMYVDMIKAAELGGAMDEILKRLAQQLEREKSILDNIKTATFFPATLISFSILIIVAVLWFIVPVFMDFFPPGMELPVLTELIITMSKLLHSYWYLGLLTPLVLFLLFRLFVRSRAGKVLWESIKFKIPVIGDLLKKATVARFCRTLSTLLTGGIPVIQALEAAGPASGSAQVANIVKEATVGIQRGLGIAPLLSKHDFFPPMMIDMVAVGEESGQISELLDRAADFYEDEVATMTKGLTSLLEPVLLIFVGSIIAVIITAVYMPIFSVVTSGLGG